MSFNYLMNKKLINALRLSGPGILYAAAAVGVSHIVQSTRAGAEFGLGLVWVVILANLLKYPFFKAGAQYSAVTGKSLLYGYKRLGTWALLLFVLITFMTMFVIQSAVTVVTSGLTNHIFSIPLSVQTTSVVLLAICSLILLIGNYGLLDNLVKVIVAALSLTTVLAVGFSFFGDIEKNAPPVSFNFNNSHHLYFLVALIGWMPAPLDVPVWQSVWTVAKRKKTKTTVNQTLMDFKVGYIGTAALAVFFLMLGAIIMYRSGQNFSPKAVPFAAQFIGLYSNALGSWAMPIVSIAAFLTMFSTTLTCLDAFSRVMQESMVQLFGHKFSKKDWYIFWLSTTLTGTIVLLFNHLGSMKELVDFATTVSFLFTPIFGILILKVMNSNALPPNWRYGKSDKLLGAGGIILSTILLGYYLSLTS